MIGSWGDYGPEMQDVLNISKTHHVHLWKVKSFICRLLTSSGWTRRASDLEVGSSCSPQALGLGRNWIKTPKKWNYWAITPKYLWATGIKESRRKVYTGSSGMRLGCPYFSSGLFPQPHVQLPLTIEIMSKIFYGLFSIRGDLRFWTASITCIDLKSSYRKEPGMGIFLSIPITNDSNNIFFSKIATWNEILW